MVAKYLIAEYCEGPFYMGWWLYLRDRNDGSQNDDKWDRWGWLRCDCFYGRPCRCVMSRIAALCRTLRVDVPDPFRGEQRLAEWFATTFPAGLRVERPEEGGYRLLEIVKELPKQVSRRVIRTRARADRSFARACKRNAD